MTIEQAGWCMNLLYRFQRWSICQDVDPDTQFVHSDWYIWPRYDLGYIADSQFRPAGRLQRQDQLTMRNLDSRCGRSKILLFGFYGRDHDSRPAHSEQKTLLAVFQKDPSSYNFWMYDAICHEIWKGELR